MQDAMKMLTSALKRLRADQTAGRRTSARRAVGAAIRVLKLRVDEQFPRAAKPSTYKPVTGNEKERAAAKRARLEKRGWRAATGVDGANAQHFALLAGVAAKRVERAGSLGGVDLMLPGWVFSIDTSRKDAVSQMKRAKTDRTFRKALLTASALS
jgi:hypothetical protein